MSKDLVCCVAQVSVKVGSCVFEYWCTILSRVAFLDWNVTGCCVVETARDAFVFVFAH